MISNTKKYKEIMIPIIIKHAPSAKIILFGSRARNDDNQGSDIDIALDLGKKIDFTIMNNILGDLEESMLPIKFDIVDFNAVSQDLQKEIVKDGVWWKK